MQRRTLVKLLASAAAGLRAAGLRAFADPNALTDAQVATLRAAARVALPSALGAKGADEVVDRFVRWLRAYRSGAEMDHGYGVTRLRTTPASPALGYKQQFARLDTLAAAKGKPFVRLDPGAQRDVIATALAGAKIDALPGRPNGRHVIADLMAFYFQSTEANDLCYHSAIGKDTCRGLPDSDKAPAPLTGRAKALRHQDEHAASGGTGPRAEASAKVGLQPGPSAAHLMVEDPDAAR